MNSKRFFKTLICSAGLLAASLLAGCGGGDQGRAPILGLPAASLVSIVVTPATATVAIGATQQFSTIAAYTDGSAVDVSAKAQWTSANPALATVNASGVGTAIKAGTLVISAAFEGKSAGATLTVAPAKLVAIALTPTAVTLNSGLTQQYTVTGTFDDKTSADVTAASVFSVAAPATAGISATGLATARAVGATTVSALASGLSASASLTVLPAAVVSLTLTPATSTLQVGASRQLAAVATYTDGAVVDVTRVATFASATPAAVSINAGGLITGVAAGSAILNASFGGQSATAQATTTAATITRIVVLPAAATVAVGVNQQFAAVATYSDGATAVVTASAAWTSSSTAIATVLNTGVATGQSVGIATISASAGGQTASGVLTVTPPAATPTPTPTPVPPTFVPVNLGSAANFAVLAGTALTSKAGGTTLIGGDVGSPSQTTAPTVAPGFTNYQSGAILNNALADL